MLHRLQYTVQRIIWTLSVGFEMMRMSGATKDPYLRRIQASHRLLGIPAGYSSRGLPLHREAEELVAVPCGRNGKHHWMTPLTKTLWTALYAAASTDGITLIVRYAYRSVDDQAQLIREQLSASNRSSIDELMTWMAAPGYSEHHTGCALDFESSPVGQAFETTAAFDWLCMNAQRHGFALSYPQGNAQGIIFEPWHWCCIPRDGLTTALMDDQPPEPA